MINPILPASNEATSIAILEVSIISVVSKASSVIKIDMVKPMPPKKPAPRMFFHFRSFGKTQSPKAVPRNEKSQIPRGLPITKPEIIPILFS